MYLAIIQLWWLWLILSFMFPLMLLIAVPATILSLFDTSELIHGVKEVPNDKGKLLRSGKALLDELKGLFIK